jgi:ankyrin repeat protein
MKKRLLHVAMGVYVCNLFTGLTGMDQDCQDGHEIVDRMVVEAQPAAMRRIRPIIQNYNLEFNTFNQDGNTPLIQALLSDDQAQAEQLIVDVTVDVNKANSDGDNALIIATSMGNKEAVRLLLERTDIDVNPLSGDADGMKSVFEYSARPAYKPSSKLLDLLGLPHDARKYELFQAINNNPPIRQQFLSRLKKRVIECDKTGETPLLIALKNKHIEIACMLLSHRKININARSYYTGNSVLHYAVQFGLSELAKRLLADAQLEVNCANCKEMTPLDYAICLHNSEIAQDLLSHESAKFNRVSTIEHALLSSPEMAKLVAFSPKISFIKDEATTHRLLEMLSLNIVSEARQVIEDRYNLEAELWAENPSLVAVVRALNLLIQHAVSLKSWRSLVKNLVKESPLAERLGFDAMQGSFIGYIICRDLPSFVSLKKFMRSGISHAIADQIKQCYLISTRCRSLIAHRVGNIIIVEKLPLDQFILVLILLYDTHLIQDSFQLPKGCELIYRQLPQEIRTKFGIPEFVYCAEDMELAEAVARHDIDRVAQLIELGANVDYKKRFGPTLLYVACEEGFTQIVRMLIDAGADINYANILGYPPLYTASARGCSEIVQMLIDAGADLDFRSKTGETPLFAAAICGHTQIVGMLIAAGAHLDAIACAWQDYTSLHFACMQGNVDIVTMLLNSKADVDVINADNKTPRMLAEEKGHGAIVALLDAHSGASRS